MCGHDEHVIVTERRGREHLLLQNHLLVHIGQTTQRLHFGALRETQLLGARPEIFLIKTEDVVADQNVRIPGLHRLQPANDHAGLCLIGMHGRALHGVARAHSKDVLAGRFTALCEDNADLDDRITSERQNLGEGL